MQEDEVRSWLTKVIDPELGHNIVELGLVYAVRFTPTQVEIDLLTTSAACPMSRMLQEDVEKTVKKRLTGVQAGKPVIVQVVHTPAWTPDRMTGAARNAFGWEV